MGDHIVLFIFYNKLELDRVLASQPWSFDKHLIAIQRYELWMSARDLCFNIIQLWVQVYDIPVRFMNRVVAEDTCSGIGEVCPFEYSEMEGGDYMRV